jgi:hypothetical protein
MSGDDRGPGGAGTEGRSCLGEILLVLLSATLSGIRDRLHDDGYDEEADLVGDLVDITDDYLARATSLPPNAETCHSSSLQ